MSFITYQLLSGFFQESVTDAAVIQEAFLLEKQGLVLCFQTSKGLKIQPCLEGIDRWMQNKLKQESLHWIRYRLCFYGIYNPSKPVIEHIVNGQRTLLVSYEPLKISTDSTQKDSLCFADLFCGKIALSSVLQHLLYQGKFSATLTENSEGFFLDHLLLFQKRAFVRKNLLSLLVQHRQNYQNKFSYPYLDFEDIADLFYQKTKIYVENMKTQIYKPLYEMNQRSQKLKSCDLIDLKPKKARIDPSIFCL